MDNCALSPPAPGAQTGVSLQGGELRFLLCSFSTPWRARAAPCGAMTPKPPRGSSACCSAGRFSCRDARSAADGQQPVYATRAQAQIRSSARRARDLIRAHGRHATCHDARPSLPL